MSCQIDSWKATASGEGEDRVITVSGSGECGTPGHQLRLEPGNEGPGDDPGVAALRLVVVEPEAGPEVMTPESVEAEIKGDPATKVRIDFDGSSRFVDVEAA